MGATRYGFILLFVPFCLSFLPDQSKKNLPKEEPYLGIAVKKANVVLDGQNKKLLEIAYIFFGPAKSKDLRRGDVILAVDGQAFDNPAAFRSYILKKRPGSEIVFQIIRKQSAPEGKRTFREFTQKVLISRKEEYAATLGRKGQTPFSPNKVIRSLLDKKRLPIERFLRETINVNRLEMTWKGLLESMAEDEMKWPDPFKIDPVSLCRRNPLKVPAMESILIDDLQKASGPDLSSLVRVLAGTIGIPLNGKGEVDQEIFRSSSFDQYDVHPIFNPLIKRLKVSLMTATEARSLAFRRLSEKDRAFIWKQAPKLLKDLKANLYLDGVEDEERFKGHHRLLGLAARIDFRALFQMGEAFSWLLDRGLLERLANDLERPLQMLPGVDGIEGSIVSMEMTPWGPIVIGGTEGNIYDCQKLRPAVIIDLGGDDRYLGPCGASIDEQSPFGIVLDLSGNDNYDAGNHAFSQGSGMFGVGILIDREGMDTYLATDMAQGASFIGIGILWDLSGSDRYKGDGYLQGAAAYGLACLIDEGGDDQYEGRLFSQGLGLTGGLGVLIDREGNDRYTATGDKSEKGAGFSQGMGVGFRQLSAGGMGILFDLKGQDIYKARDFSQGGGYFFGFGLLHDEEGDDKYLCRHYGQGFGAHSAVGILFDRAGDDTYFCESGVCQGGAWDKSVGWLIDEKGRDRFHSEGMGQGASALRSFATLFKFGEGHFSGKGTQIQGYGGGEDDPLLAGSLGILIQAGKRAGFFSTWDHGMENEKGLSQAKSRIRNNGRSGYGIITLTPDIDPEPLRSPLVTPGKSHHK